MPDVCEQGSNVRPPSTGLTARPKLSTRNLGAGFVSAVVAATGLGVFPAGAGAKLPDRNVYYPRTCDYPNSAHNGPQVSYASISNYGHAGYRCSANSRSGQVRIWTWNYNRSTHGYSALASAYGIGAVSYGAIDVGGDLVHNEVKLRSYPYNLLPHYLSGVSH